ncbi:MAG: Ig-like domain-containing protein [Bacillota bacterium]|nr:Ig-like domain-containing protein [Bacillota bacterium]
MKRVNALVIAMLMALAIAAPTCLAAKETTADNSALKIEVSTPEDGAEGVSVENLSVKLTMNKEMSSLTSAQKKHNQSAIKLTDPKGKKIKVNAYYSKEHPDQVMIVSATSNNKSQRFDSATKYTLTIGKNFSSADGSTFDKDQVISFTTLNQKRSMMIYMILMGLMMAGMIFFSMKSAKKNLEKEKEKDNEVSTVNPYKEAKRTGKTVEEIVEEDRKRKAKAAKASERRRAEIEALEAEIRAEEHKQFNKRVSVRRPISAAGSEYKVKAVSNQPKNSQSTNPKGQSGKQKNKKGGKKK